MKSQLARLFLKKIKSNQISYVLENVDSVTAKQQNEYFFDGQLPDRHCRLSHREVISQKKKTLELNFDHTKITKN